MCLLEKPWRKKCALHLKQEMVRFIMVLSTCGSSFHSLRWPLEKHLTLAQKSFTLIVESSIVPRSIIALVYTYLEIWQHSTGIM